MLTSQARRVVLDTSVVISGIHAKENDHEESNLLLILRWFEAGHFLLESNAKILDEYRRKMREKLQDGFLKKPEVVGIYFNMFQDKALFDRLLVTPPIYIPADPTDNIYFASNNCLTADYLVTSNTKHFTSEIQQDLVQLGSKLRIVTPAEFVAAVRQEN